MYGGNMVSIQEVFQLSIEMDMVHLAHRIFRAIAEGIVKVGKNSERLDAVDYDDEAISKMVVRNQLIIGKISYTCRNRCGLEWG